MQLTVLLALVIYPVLLALVLASLRNLTRAVQTQLKTIETLHARMCLTEARLERLEARWLSAAEKGVRN